MWRSPGEAVAGHSYGDIGFRAHLGQENYAILGKLYRRIGVKWEKSEEEISLLLTPRGHPHPVFPHPHTVHPLARYCNPFLRIAGGCTIAVAVGHWRVGIRVCRRRRRISICVRWRHNIRGGIIWGRIVIPRGDDRRPYIDSRTMPAMRTIPSAVMASPSPPSSHRSHKARPL